MPPNHPITLNNGITMPLLGLGVWSIANGDPTTKAVRAALDAGYRHVDTAAMYGNEQAVGRAVRESGLAREELFVTTKVWNTDHGYDNTLRAFDASAGRLDLGPVDLYLIHWPSGGRLLETWRALEKLLADGRVRAIGVSNYRGHHLTELLDHAAVVPAVNQIELTPYNYYAQGEVVEMCRQQGIQLVAYSPLTQGRKLKDPRLVALARQYNKTPAQLLLRWLVQQGIAAIPKSTRPERIRENAAIFDFQLSAGDVADMAYFNENQ